MNIHIPDSIFKPLTLIKALLPKIKNLWQKTQQFTKMGKSYVAQGSQANFSELKYRLSRDKKRRNLRKLPWYLMLGSPQSGKQTVIKNTGLYFVKPEHFGEDGVNYIKQAPDFEWYFSERAVVIDAMGADIEHSKASWRRLVKLLKRERRHQPINGVIINLSLTDLLLKTNQERQVLIQECCDHIRHIHDTFKSIVPLYVVFNKCDLVEGFMEFFNDLGKEELQQVWGITVPMSQCQDVNSTQAFFSQAYTGLVKQLRKRVMWSLDTERTARGRELINAFPQQMQLFRRPIENFIAEIFSAVRQRDAMQFRGLYFTSCTQNSGEPVDFVMQAMSKKFQLVPPKFQRPQRLGECYFMQGLFFNVIHPEARNLGFSERAKKRRQFFYTSTLFVLPALIIWGIVGMHFGFNENAKNLTQIDNAIDGYHNAVGRSSIYDPAVTSTLPALKYLSIADQRYQQNTGFGLDFLFVSSIISHKVHDAFQRSLHSLLLPRVAAKLQNELGQNVQNLSLLYAILKGYLVFSADAKTGPDDLKLAIQNVWAQQFHRGTDTFDTLSHYLDIALHRSIAKLSLNEDLIDNVLTRLEQVVPSQRAYGILALQAHHLPNLMLASAVGDHFDHIFTSKTALNIDGFYTRAGFESIFKPHYSDIASTVAQDNRDIGLSNDSDDSQTAEQIRQAIQEKYQNNYLSTWKHTVAYISLKPFSSLSNAIASLNLITGTNSPMAKLLNIIHDNTAPIHHSLIHVASQYAALNTYTQSTANSNSWAHAVVALKAVRDTLQKLDQTTNPDESAFNIAKAAMQGSKATSPIQQLAAIAQSAPYPLNQWLQNLAQNTWQIILQSAYQYMNSAWHRHVWPLYQNSIEHRYPFTQSTLSQVRIANFNTFFKYDGLLENFFNEYLKPFINTSNTTWQGYTVHGLSMQLPQDLIDRFVQAEQIRHEFFSSSHSKAEFSFSIQPLLLSSKASGIQIILGEQQLGYQDGPQMVSHIHWPLPESNNNASVSITDFDNNQYTHNASGPWSLFQILNRGKLKEVKKNGTYHLTFDFNGLNALYKITGNSKLSHFTLSHLKGFTLPEKLAPTLRSSDQVGGRREGVAGGERGNFVDSQQENSARKDITAPLSPRGRGAGGEGAKTQQPGGNA